MDTLDHTQTDPAFPTDLYGYRQSFAVAAADMAARIDLVACIDESVPWDPRQCKVSPGTRILALVIGMMVDPMALYRLEEFYADMDCAVLFGAERQAHDFNDDAIGRALSKLFESEVGQTYHQLSLQAVTRLGLPATTTAHADTTSLTLTGEYGDPMAPGSRPMHGYNKDGHPECKQLVAGVVTRSDGVPLTVDVLDGNADDTTWSRDALLSHVVDPRDEVLFVADSKAISHQSVEDFCERGIRYVSRLPNTFALEVETKAAAAAAATATWHIVGAVSAQADAATHRVWETAGIIGEQSQRLVVVHSSALAAKAEHRLAQRQEEEANQFDRDLARLARQRFACAADADAEAAWTDWSATAKVRRATWMFAGSVVEEAGLWRIEAQRGGRAADGIAAEQFRRSTFILISNDTRRTARELLEAYKTQFVAEQDHAVVKGPLRVVPIFVKDTAKITAYVYVAYMALLLWKCMEAVMRQNQAKLGITLPYPNRRLQPAPTTKRLKEIVAPIQIIHWRDRDGRLHRSRSDLTLVQRQALLLLGMDPRRFVQIPSG